MNNLYRTLLLLLATALLQSCATAPKFDTSTIDPDITPQQVDDGIERLKGVRVLWGGVIIASANLKASTQLEILAYPLDSSQRPDLDKAPQGRFLAVQPGYLETTDYAQGRLVSISGTLLETRRGQIGESDYTYPVMEIEQLHLWPKQRGGASDTRFHFGLGVMFSN